MLPAKLLTFSYNALGGDGFQYADGAVPATIFSGGLSWQNVAGTQAIASNKLSMGTGSIRTLPVYYPDVVIRSNVQTNTGEGILFRYGSDGSYFFVNNLTGVGTQLGFTPASGPDQIIATIPGSALYDDVIVVVQGTAVDIIRNNKIIGQYAVSNTNNAVNAKIGIVSKQATGTALLQYFFYSTIVF